MLIKSATFLNGGSSRWSRVRPGLYEAVRGVNEDAVPRVRRVGPQVPAALLSAPGWGWGWGSVQVRVRVRVRVRLG